MASPEDPPCTKPRSQYVGDELLLASLAGITQGTDEGIIFTLDLLMSPKWSQVCTLDNKKPGGITAGEWRG